MPFQRKTLSTLINEVAADINSALQGADATLRFTVLKVIGKVQAGLSNLHMGYLDWIAKQSVPFTAEAEYLEGWAGLKKVYRKAASAAQLSAKFAGVAGTPLSAGTSVVRSDGVTYTTVSTATVDGTGTLSVTIVATAAGSAGNADAGTSLSLGTAVAGIQSTGSVTGTVQSGADVEQDDALRTRMLAAYQNTPQGGDANDYAGWALAVPGVTRAWVAPNGFGAGTVVVYTMWDIAEASHNGFPQGTNGVSQYDQGPGGIPRGTAATGDQLVVADSLINEQPVTALVYSCAPVPNSLTFTLSGLSGTTTATRAAIAAAISDVLFRNGDPRAGTVNRSDIESAIASVSGTSGFVITLVQGVVSGTTTTYPGNITSGTGQLPVLAGVNYV
ncbi:baseplate J/gp47 family protein [Caballeronia sp. LZ062]|uniref:baseplate J/gp47 family protein n=1 Tax=unclassified Caballeronia TaxID=2646786 RepID=UPI0028631552|nr:MULTISPECIES: baseplate J/gp47 family protein [unclassified Caballeronia]MDR5857246.1 baseplate J/gp47 family protein [Caballeronia sp. LZ050]MDR5868797.1 baseplate J/gp47 family protein [Caballeronia sp. LZ062]